MKETNAPKTFYEEFQRMPIDYQKRVRWTFRIAMAWASTVVIGAGIFFISKPYMNKRREEKLNSGEFFKEINEDEEKFGLKAPIFKSVFNEERAKELLPPPHLMDMIGKVVTEDEKKESV